MLEHRCILRVFGDILDDVLLAEVGHDLLRRFLAVDLDRVDVDDQLSIEERCLQIGFAVQIATFEHRQWQLIERDAHLAFELIALDLDVHRSFQLFVLVDQGVHVVAGQDQGLDRRSGIHSLAKCLHAVFQRLTFLGRHFDFGKLFGGSCRVFIDQLAEHAIADEDEDSHENRREHRQHAGDDATVKEASALVRRSGVLLRGEFGCLVEFGVIGRHRILIPSQSSLNIRVAFPHAPRKGRATSRISNRAAKTGQGTGVQVGASLFRRVFGPVSEIFVERRRIVEWAKEKPCWWPRSAR